MGARWERCEATWVVGFALGSAEVSRDLRLVIYFGCWKLMIASAAFLAQRDADRVAESEAR